MPEIYLRTFWAVGIITLGLSVYRIVTRIVLMRIRRKSLGLDNYRLGKPTILYFTAPGCVPCKTVQQPALIELQRWLGDALEIITVDAIQNSELADYWGVLSVPTTFLIDSLGQARLINHGATQAEKMLNQLEKIEGRSLIKLEEEIRSEISSI